MTVKNMVEEIKLIIPEAKEALILKEIDSAQKTFVDATRCLKKSSALSGVSSNITWTLPTDFLGLYRVDFYDTNSKPIYPEEDELGWDVEGGSFTLKSLTSTPLTSVPSDIIYINLVYEYQPGDIDEITDTLEVDEEFHEGIKARAVSKLLAIFPTIEAVDNGRVLKLKDYQGIRYWQGVYDEIRIQCKRHMNMEDQSEKIYASIYKDEYIVEPKRTKI